MNGYMSTSHWASIPLINGQIQVVDLRSYNGQDLTYPMVRSVFKSVRSGFDEGNQSVILLIANTCHDYDALMKI